MHLSKLIECTTRRNLNGLWVIVMCQRRFLDCNTWSTLVGDADKRGFYACEGGRRVDGKSLYLLLNFAVNLKLL